jgi:hypothetical protein
MKTTSLIMFAIACTMVADSDWLLKHRPIADILRERSELAPIWPGEMGHTFQHYRSMADAFAGKSAAFNQEVIRLISDWLEEQLTKS